MVNNYYDLVNALKDLDIDVVSLENLIFDPQKTYLRIPHKTFKTEFLPQLTGLPSYNDSKQRSKAINLDGNEINIIGYKYLILNKKSIDREIDREDIKVLQRLNQDRGL